MSFSRRDWLKTAFLGATAMAFSPIDVLAKEVPGFKEIIDQKPVRLCFNENPFGLSPKAKQAMIDNLGEASKYDFGLGNQLKSKIATTIGLQTENLILTAGSSMVLELVAYFTAMQKGHIIYPDPSFTIFAGISEFLGMKETKVPLTEGKKIDLKQIKKSIREDTKLVYLCNPNNPTGDLLSREEILAFLDQIPSHITVLVDEAYIEFTNQKSLADQVSKYKNLVIARTFSKLYGMAGARLGFAVAHPETISKISKLSSWSGGEVSVITISAGLAALEDQAFVSKVLASNLEAKNFLYDQFKKNGISFIPSNTNFVYFSLQNYKDDYFSKLKKANILGGKTYEDKEKWTRISIGTPEEMALFSKTVFA